ncbi:hypothetical protein Q8A67_024374 [Cirrhinus molitorella]|uniref:Uncharacterized protein n=1 Tax=Cirrhinus molitorella TaxID=172907 RepID=A0AA88P497_9TELE|nr:hypothetical protein Q8A67_024374 [Cirrhinus molitorella]
MRSSPAIIVRLSAKVHYFLSPQGGSSTLFFSPTCLLSQSLQSQCPLCFASYSPVWDDRISVKSVRSFTTAHLIQEHISHTAGRSTQEEVSDFAFDHPAGTLEVPPPAPAAIVSVGHVDLV